MDILRRISIILLFSFALSAGPSLSDPSEHIRVKGQECKFKYRQNDIDVDLRDLTGGVDYINVPKVELDKQNKTIIIGLCKGLNMTCQGKLNKGTAACLIDQDSVKFDNNNSSTTTILTSQNSKIVGAISKSHIRLVNHRILYESVTFDKNCKQENKSDNEKIPFGTRLEFFCSNSTAPEPTFLKYDNCTYILEWGTKGMCQVEASMKNANANKSKVIVIKDANNSTATATAIATKSTNTTTNTLPKISDKDLKIDLDPKPKSAEELHKENLEDAKKLLEHEHDQSNKDINNNRQPVINIADKIDNKNNSDVKKTNTNNNDLHVLSTSETHIKPTTVATHNPIPMIGLILISLMGFVIVIFVLEKRTRLGEIRRRAGLVFRQQQQQSTTVPYRPIYNREYLS